MGKVTFVIPGERQNDVQMSESLKCLTVSEFLKKGFDYTVDPAKSYTRAGDHLDVDSDQVNEGDVIIETSRKKGGAA